jgi:hypothetical protein
MKRTKVPAAQVMRSTIPAGSGLQPPIDRDSYSTSDDVYMPRQPGIRRSMPKPAGSRPLTIKAKLPGQRKRRAPVGFSHYNYYYR